MEYEPSEEDFLRAAEIIRTGSELEDSHLDIRAAAIKVFMVDYEGLDFASWSRRIIRQQSGRYPSDDFREVEQLVRETNGLSMKLSGGFNHSEAREAHQDTKYAFQDLREVARRGWSLAKERLLETPSGQAVATAVEKLARFLKRERLSESSNLKVQPTGPSNKFDGLELKHRIQQMPDSRPTAPSSNYKP